jgi:hypothetical protein
MEIYALDEPWRKLYVGHHVKRERGDSAMSAALEAAALFILSWSKRRPRVESQEVSGEPQESEEGGSGEMARQKAEGRREDIVAGIH